ncbi:xanthine dehydrogenase family protein molybdopterin-binding subunit [Achromobacter sp. GG226]|uniref:xanthine dehydrogenase family protein molybdopterin-binding subunit n=1 Tax=Verticiella alkaliphila TaxID=2779529 RepID=UPI001C0B8EA0|nr:xanthine dehydrogenase family protein molybdopterin-binding subunit [Verticiella sp. GG226]MBU4612747.1 xanthine dehydrogenase family protein molybdopterin-binding subunit [Verticiella sp. GG226]
MNAPESLPLGPVGQSTDRIDGPLKVTGHATYTVDHDFPGLVHAMPVGAKIAAGRLVSLDVAAARAMPGVIEVFTRENIGTLYRVAKASGVMVDERRPPLSDDEIAYYGQYIALVVAESFEVAMAAAASVTAQYEARAVDVSATSVADDDMQTEAERGDPQAAFDAAEITVDETYVTPTETHNPIELHASVAVYEDGRFTLYETSQAVVNHKAALVQMLGVAAEDVRVVTRYLGSGFGGKLWPWPHSVLAAAAARALGRPVKLEVTRAMMFHNVGHRPRTQQRVRLSADRDGRLTSLRQDYVVQNARRDEYQEDCGEATAYLYSTPNLRVTWGAAKRDVGSPTSMRGPGAVPGLYAIESAMNELARKLEIDPVDLRLRNDTLHNEDEDVPFSSRHLAECLRTGAERFGWRERNPAVGAMQRDGRILGWGMASASWMAQRLGATVAVTAQANGRIRVATASQDIGTGTYTVLAQMVSRVLGVALDRIDVCLGDTALPSGPLSGGSMATGSLVPAASDAARDVANKLIQTATEGDDTPFADADPDSLELVDGQVRRKGQTDGVGFMDILQRARLSQLSGNGRSGSSKADPGADERSTKSFGAHFVEVSWEPAIARLRVERVVTVIDGGQILNPKAGRNQIEGAIIMGLGMALFESADYDPETGAVLNSNLADYIMPVHADAPELDVTFLDHPDYALNELGARGIGEIGLAGLAAAITDAVHHATGVRVRELPVTVEALLEAPLPDGQ